MWGSDCRVATSVGMSAQHSRRQEEQLIGNQGDQLQGILTGSFGGSLREDLPHLLAELAAEIGRVEPQQDCV
jgi:hypothetical protein